MSPLTVACTEDSSGSASARTPASAPSAQCAAPSAASMRRIASARKRSSSTAAMLGAACASGASGVMAPTEPLDVVPVYDDIRGEPAGNSQRRYPVVRVTGVNIGYELRDFFDSTQIGQG